MTSRTIKSIGLLALFTSVWFVETDYAGRGSPVLASGYALLPEPQKVELKGADFEFGSGWRLELGPGVKPDDVAVESLKEDMEKHNGVTFATSGRGKAIELAIQPRSIEVGQATDKNKQALEEQAYKLALAMGGIRITANAPTGLFYGVETLVQLVKSSQGKLWLPEGEIVDWPDLELRNIYWDNAHHLERPEVLKAAIRQAAFYKINGFPIKLDGHFQYKSAPAVVEPYALSPGQLQELTNYALRYHVQLIPYLDGPAHVAFILKHPEYSKLREFSDSNYGLCSTNPNSYTLLEGMFQDLLDATQGAKYFLLSTDEPYFIGIADTDQCHSRQRAKELGSPGKLLAEYVTKTASYLHERGREVIFWDGLPLVPSDVSSLPSYVIAGGTWSTAFDEACKVHGIRMMIYTSPVGYQVLLFPSYYVPPFTEMLPGPAGGAYAPVRPGPGAISKMFDFISYTPQREHADLVGSVVAGWGDVGLNTETMWLGYVTGSAADWHPGAGNPWQLMASFYQLFYGPGTQSLGRLYQLMSEQAEFYKESWDVIASEARRGIWGDWAPIIFKPRKPAEDQTLPLPPTPSGDLLNRDHGWANENARRLELASFFCSQNDELMDLLNQNLSSVRLNKYNLEVYVSIALLYRQNLEMLADLQQINTLLNSAQAAAAKANDEGAVRDLDRALDTAKAIRTQRNTVYANAVQVWEKAWFPRVEEANGRRYLNEVDDVKDHLPMRTADLSYLIYRELLLPMGKWYAQVEAARNQYAKSYGLAARTDKLDWENYQTSAH